MSQTAEYALRAMAYLGQLPEDESVRAKDLSEKTLIPVHYLSKIMRRLVLHGLVESQKGHGGGFKLARPPSEITFLMILRAVDAAPVEDRCTFGWGNCNHEIQCPLHNASAALQESYVEWANTTTLAHVRTWVPPEGELTHGAEVD